MRPLSGYFFEDYALGQKFVHATPRTITHGDCALYLALTGSRQTLHCSEPFARSLGYPAAPVDDLLVFHIAFGKTVPDISYNAIANLGYADCRFVQPVYVGDTIRAETEIIGLRDNSKGTSGVIYVRSNAFNQRDELVLTWVRWVMVHRRQVTNNAAAVPLGTTNFTHSVDRSALSVPTFIKPSPHLEATTGSARVWNDFSAPADQELTAGFEANHTLENIVHPAGLTIDETDHTLATKLYQNTARVHFDAHHMQQSRFGKRLIYGGQVISICRALAYDGLENALSILAINSGTHHRPVFAGDTLYAVSTVLMAWPVNDHFGALRIKLSGYKNVEPNQASANGDHTENQVLSLDYTVLMPCRT